MSDWQPIETAPKDGTPILGWAPDSELANPVHYAVIWWFQWTELGGWVREGDEYDIAADPTHWMPLPDAPK